MALDGAPLMRSHLQAAGATAAVAAHSLCHLRQIMRARLVWLCAASKNFVPKLPALLPCKCCPPKVQPAVAGVTDAHRLLRSKRAR